MVYSRPFYAIFGHPEGAICGGFFSGIAALPSEANVDVIGISYFGNDYVDDPMDASRQL